ncbi:MAG: hypothetical protein KKE62_11035 [Proteobacteria bacterium]|nr:hypothetical protein [Pseudomonadota bacterium]MBU1389139.1 hypothetical protein [Pseudomonadota bacterium]MBU1543363.1 hypothetical protein [Pseudomonadota bacterium]MBU2481451.1 hypothetical protein [Pseudomonadota bacterium]
MAQRINKKKTKNQTPSHSYYAIKSQNELYYQMASIFKNVGRDEDVLAQKIISTSLRKPFFEISIGN